MVATAKPVIVDKRPWIPERQDIIWINGNHADNPFVMAEGGARGKKAEKTSYVLCHQPKSFDWRSRKASPHPLNRLANNHFAECCACLNQIVQLAL